MLMNKHQKGFSAVEALIILFIIALLAFIGWFVWDKQQDKDASKDKADTSQKNEDKEETPDLKEYKSNEAGLSFKYLETWTLTDGVGNTEFGVAGEITVKHPDGLILSIKADQGGKGGGCAEDPGDTPHNTKKNCSTSETLKREKVIAKADYPALDNDVYLVRVKFTTGQEVGGATTYNLVLTNNGEQSEIGSRVGAWQDLGLITRGTETEPPYIETTLKGFDRSISDLFEQKAVKEAEDILRSVRLFSE